MELEELKYQLNENAVKNQLLSESDLALLLKQQTFSVVRKLQNSIKFELYSNVAVMVVFIAVCIYTNIWSIRVYFETFFLLAIVLLVFLIFLLRKINHLNATVLPVKHNLETIYTIINDYKTMCFRLTMLLIPLCIIYLVILSFADQQQPMILKLSSIFHTHSSSVWLICFIVIYLLALTIGAYYFTKWWLNRLYGKYLKQLKELIGELEE